MTTKVLIGSPIHQKPRILKHFLASLQTIDQQGMDISFYFIDDNDDLLSSELLVRFQEQKESVYLEKSEIVEQYTCDEKTHYWKESLIWKVASFKNKMIKEALRLQVDYLFLIDSDLLLHPKTLQQLLSVKKEIVSEIFWTKWQPHSPELPQVWLKDQYTQYNKKRGETLTELEMKQKQHLFLEKMRIPGVYEVGGLGACTLISKKAMEWGVNFNEIPNLTFWGEDRHFCIRAQALGIPLHVDTTYPATHLYRESDVEALERRS